MLLETMFRTHPKPASTHGQEAVDCIEACTECAQACTVCADACLSEADPTHLVQCIRLDLDCAEICELTARLLARPSHRDAPTLRLMLQTCSQICRACGDECTEHAETEKLEHCRICADACRRCVTACDQMIAALVP